MTYELTKNGVQTYIYIARKLIVSLQETTFGPCTILKDQRKKNKTNVWASLTQPKQGGLDAESWTTCNFDVDTFIYMESKDWVKFQKWRSAFVYITSSKCKNFYVVVVLTECNMFDEAECVRSAPLLLKISIKTISTPSLIWTWKLGLDSPFICTSYWAHFHQRQHFL